MVFTPPAADAATSPGGEAFGDGWGERKNAIVSGERFFAGEAMTAADILCVFANRHCG